jgi:hypothetical protein
MSKIITIFIITLALVTLPWVGFKFWEILPIDFRLNSIIIRNIVNIILGVFIGFLFIKQEIKLRILPVLLLFFVASNVIWSYQRFEFNKQDLIKNAINYPKSLPECEKESNYTDLWDYMSNGCHFTTENFILTNIDRVLILTIAILSSRILFLMHTYRKSNKKNQGLIDQEG